MCKFYGWTLDQVLALPVDDFEYFWAAITVLEAREMLNLMAVGDYSNMKQSGRDKLFKQLSDEAYPSSLKPVRQMATNELAKILGG